MCVKEIGKAETKNNINEILAKNELPYIPITYYSNDGFFIPKYGINNEKLLYGISVTMCNKDCCKIYPHEILYIAIEDRKNVLYLTNGKIETYLHLEHWINILDERYFVQPHCSYIVNLHYVSQVTKDFVKLKYRNKEHYVYTSSRKIGAFKKVFLNLKE